MKTIAALIVLGAASMAWAWTIDTVAGNGDKAVVGQPFGVEFGPDGQLYICEVENHRIQKLDLKTGKLTPVAGTGKRGYSGDGGPALSAEMNEPYELRFDAGGNLWVVEMKNHVVRRIDARTGIITTVAGTGQPGFSGDGGQATAAQFNQPHSIALDAAGHLYICDIQNHRIRKVDAKTGVVTTIAGTGDKKLPIDGQPAAGKPILGPRAMFIDGSTMWIALREGHSVWKMDLSDGVLRFVAGSGKRGFDDGAGRQATFDGPKGIAVGPDKAVYVMDTENHAARRIDPATGMVTTIAGGGPKSRGYGGDGGDALKAKMDRPHGLCVGPDGAVYMGDTNTHRVRRAKP
jgi:streptogramin lyase